MDDELRSKLLAILSPAILFLTTACSHHSGTYYELFLDDTKVGYSRILNGRQHEGGGETTYETEEESVIWISGQVGVETETTVWRVNGRGEVLGAECRHDEKGLSGLCTLVVSNGTAGFLRESSLGSEKAERRLPPGSAVLGPRAVALLRRLHFGQVGRSYAYLEVGVWGMAVYAYREEILRKEEVWREGEGMVEVSVARQTPEAGGNASEVLFYSDGTVLSEECSVSHGIRFRQREAPRRKALDEEDSPLFCGFKFGRVPCSGKLLTVGPKASATYRLKFRDERSGSRPPFRTLEGATEITPGVFEIKQARARPPVEDPGGSLPPDSTPSDPGGLLDWDSPAIREAAASLKLTGKTRWEQALEIFSFVRDRVSRPRGKISAVSASAVLSLAEGDCTEHAILACALARAVGLPSRVVCGVVYAERTYGFMWHSWTEVYIGGWIGMDTALNMLPVDAKYIPLGHFADGKTMASGMRDLSLRLLELVEVEVLEFTER